MDSEMNKRTVLQYVDAFNRCDFDTLRPLFTPDALIYGVLGAGGMDIVEPIWCTLHATFAIRLEVTELICEGDTVAVRYVERGKSVGPNRDQAPTGKTYELVAMEWFTMKDGRIHRRWGARDSAAIFKQLELTPA